MSFGLYLLYVALAYLRPIEAFAPELAEYRLMLILSLLTLGVSIGSSLARGVFAARPQHIRLLLGFVGAILMSHIVAGRIGISIESFMDFMPSVVLFITTVANVTELRRLRVTCALIAICTVILGVASIAAYHTGFMVDKLVLYEATGPESEATPEPAAGAIPAEDSSGAFLWRVRSIGYFSDPNDFAQAIVVAFPLLAAFFQRGRPRRMLEVGLGGIVLLYTIYLTHSRGALLGVASLFLSGMRRVLGTVWTALLLGGGVAAALAVDFTGGRAYTANEESAGGRIDAWSEGLSMLASHPIFGVGHHLFTDFHDYTAHNSYVLCFAELGLVGYIFWLGLIVIALRDLGAAIRTGGNSEGARWANTVRAALIGWMTCAIFLSRTYEPLLYLVLGLCASAWYCARREAPGLTGAGTDAQLPRATPASASGSALASTPTPWLGLTIALAFASIATIYLIVLVKNATLGRSV
jgi:O-antigen ligase